MCMSVHVNICVKVIKANLTVQCVIQCHLKQPEQTGL